MRHRVANIIIHILISANPAMYCRNYPQALIAHPTNCGQYYDCSRPAGQFGAYLFECPYPQLYNSVTAAGACQVFGSVNCNGKFKPQSPCKCKKKCTTINVIVAIEYLN